ncbi:MAG: large conductance mechanosensitive channel protein MscL [Actinomycetia bacterium]|nr:large conductance mechanosensitive channel protein MscL [Actinomycetes bacterium]
MRETIRDSVRDGVRSGVKGSVKHGTKIAKEFRDFISRGNVLDLAVAVVMGAAFNAIITSAVNNLIMPLLSIITMGTDFSALYIAIGSGPNAAQFSYGNFISAVINFLLIALVIFIAIKAINRITNKKPDDAEDEPATKTCPYCASEIPEAAVRCPECTTVLDDLAIPLGLR